MESIRWKDMPEWFQESEVSAWLWEVAQENGTYLNQVMYTNYSKVEIKKLNHTFLQHDYATDVITFCYDDLHSSGLNFEAFISVEVIEEYARLENLDRQDELNRILVHALLHCLGFNDATEEEKDLMRNMEDKYLDKRIKVSRGT